MKHWQLIENQPLLRQIYKEPPIVSYKRGKAYVAGAKREGRGRYIVDIFLLWLHGEDKLHEFITQLNNLYPTIKFTGSFSKYEIPFLDVNVLLIKGTLQTDLYVNPTDKHQYLLKSSCHPSNIKKSIPYSMALRLRRICSTDDFFNKRLNVNTTHLINRGYKHRFSRCELNLFYLSRVDHVILLWGDD